MRIIKKSLSIVLGIIIALNSFGTLSVRAEENELSEVQTNAIEMLNYITVLTQEINASKNSRVYMEEAYSELLNNTNPNAVDKRTLSQMTGLLDTMENYRMIGVKRERLRYIYEQTQAKAIKSAIPNPLAVMNMVQSANPVKLVTSLIYMAVDSAASYNAYVAEAEQQYMQDGWALDDEEAKVLHESRKGTFSYMVRMVNEYNLPGDLTLTEATVDEFVDWKNNPNIVGRIQFLESNKNTYKAYGGYWITLAESYYNNGDYDKCLEAIATYDSLKTKIFRQDYELAKVLSLGIVSAKETLGKEKYVKYADKNAQRIIENTAHNEWALRYFSTQTYVDLYVQTKDKKYLQKAYDISLDSINYLLSEQKEQNEKYLNAIAEEDIPKTASKEEKKEINDYNKMMVETRKVELAPIYQPLVVNCDMLFALADKLDISDKEKNRIDNLLHPNGEKLFLCEPVDEKFWFSNQVEVKSPTIVDYSGYALVLPASYMTRDGVISVTVIGADGKTKEKFEDWKLVEVNRTIERDISSFEALFLSDSARDYTWEPNERIEVTFKSDDNSKKTYSGTYKTVGTKNEWYDYLKVWSGQKNHWYDYAKVWENSVEFEATN